MTGMRLISGAERLVVDAAMELVTQGADVSFCRESLPLQSSQQHSANASKSCKTHELSLKVLDPSLNNKKIQYMQVEVFTAFHDPKRSFRETTNGSFPVFVRGSWFPRTIFNKGHALCAYVRCIIVAICIAWKAFR